MWKQKNLFTPRYPVTKGRGLRATGDPLVGGGGGERKHPEKHRPIQTRRSYGDERRRPINWLVPCEPWQQPHCRCRCSCDGLSTCRLGGAWRGLHLSLCCVCVCAPPIRSASLCIPLSSCRGRHRLRAVQKTERTNCSHGR